jgi:hypothetical protein
MKIEKINLDAFDILLPSFSMPIDGDEMEELDSDSAEYREMCRESFLDALPDEIIHLGQVEREIENWGTYDYNEDYFIMPINEEGYNWAVFRSYWDDNYSDWQVCSEGRFKVNSDDHTLVARTVLPIIWKSRDILLDDEEYAEYKNFLETL